MGPPDPAWGCVHEGSAVELETEEVRPRVSEFFADISFGNFIADVLDLHIHCLCGVRSPVHRTEVPVPVQGPVPVLLSNGPVTVPRVHRDRDRTGTG